jgi:micrococcal nuclease
MTWKKDMQTTLFWGCIIFLLSASLFYGINVVKMQRSAVTGAGKVNSGDIVSLQRVVDGDTVMVTQQGQQPATVRILGIKSFEASTEKDIATGYGQAAIDTISRLMGNQPVRVLLHSTPKDRYGRYLATLYVDDQDIGLRLVKDGLALVYVIYPFPAMSLYLQEQESARAGRRGLWANNEMVSRALALIREWREKSQ